MLQPTVRRTGTPRGQAPVVESYDRHERLTALSAIAVSSKRRWLGLVFDLVDLNALTKVFELFVKRLLRKIGGSITNVIDRLRAHKSAAKGLLVKCPVQLAMEWRDSYSQQLNPRE